jgi:Transport and Golgi organisation 2
MCTLTVLTREDGYLAGMNRDEKIARGAGFSPGIYQLHRKRAIYPEDGNGGTWIGVNQYGVSLALLNWNEVLPSVLDTSKHSRGQIIPALLGSASLAELESALAILDLKTISPFRMFGVFPGEKEIREWRWDSVRTDFLVHTWEGRHWFSSSLSDQQAASLRGNVCREARKESDAGSVAWLRRLHASHAGGAGAFSVCVHRREVETLSYSEIACTPTSVRMNHSLGNSCVMDLLDEIQLERSAM